MRCALTAGKIFFNKKNEESPVENPPLWLLNQFMIFDKILDYW